jgi:hypothetical protein
MEAKESKRRRNERKFGNWQDLPDGGRRYWYEVQGQKGRRARYVKEVDAEENTRRFWQEIYDEKGHLVEIHEKFPVDKGHQRLGEAKENDCHA